MRVRHIRRPSSLSSHFDYLNISYRERGDRPRGVWDRGGGGDRQVEGEDSGRVWSLPPAAYPDTQIKEKRPKISVNNRNLPPCLISGIWGCSLNLLRDKKEPRRKMIRRKPHQKTTRYPITKAKTEKKSLGTYVAVTIHNTGR